MDDAVSPRLCRSRPDRRPRDPHAGTRDGSAAARRGVHAPPQARRRLRSAPRRCRGGGAGLRRLEALSRTIDCAIEVLVDPAAGMTHRLGRGARTVWTSLDAMDGTVKVAGLGPRHTDRVRLGNDGGWAAGFAFTAPTERRLDELVFGDFAVAVVVDGNPTRERAYPQDLVTLPSAAGPRHLGSDRRAVATRVHDHGDGSRPALGIPRRLPGIRSRHPRARRRSARHRALPAPHQPPRRRRVRRAAPVRQSERARPRPLRMARASGLGGITGRRSIWW